jgi:hypothetical protein
MGIENLILNIKEDYYGSIFIFENEFISNKKYTLEIDSTIEIS